MAKSNEHQLSRYGAITKDLPFVTGKTFFLISATEQAAGEFLSKYPNDGDGQPRVFTTWASVITAAQLSTDSDVIMVSPLFTVAPTLAQIDSLNAANVIVWMAGQLQADGSYLATRASTALSSSTTTTSNLFNITGKILLTDIIGEVATTVGATITAKFTHAPTVGSSTDLCAATSIATLAIGGQIMITGTLANNIVTTVQGAFIRQATPLVLKAGTLNLVQSATTTGNIKYLVKYVPLDPGAFVTAV